ncbi:NADH-ubiquinone oxidoreductase 21.3 kDa subunit [Golovinomyces cichoracearum]|uniref:NADH-ubiquinone oxidoreductase 21.3 kDa subunit n=1 Tax=Golovinomyces cichoracearum TaxID=62708 RepID=A0A420HYZ3_9PEZI|nr:NADH-ubiquinone oxidoreductase 21.3 kDa subunit [Golovinomyces cichoracearum]
MLSGDEDQYKPTDAVAAGLRGAGISGAAGAILAGAQNSLTKSNVGAWGVITKFGGTITLFSLFTDGMKAAVGSIFEFVTAASANLRERNDYLNPTIGGLVSGSLIGLKVGTTPAVFGYSAGVGLLMATFNFTGGRLTGHDKNPELDEFERKQQMRKNRRRPIEETIAELGEGRGIYPPGYEERRRLRLKEKYDIDVPNKF